MSQEILSAKINQAQVVVVKTLVTKFKELNPKAKVSSPKFGQLGDGVLFSVTIDVENYNKLLVLFLDNDIKILFTKNTSGKAKELIEQYEERKKELETKKRMRDAEADFSGDKKVNSDKSITLQDIEKMTNDGNYKELLRISKSINCAPAVVEQAILNIKDAAQVAIIKLEEEALFSKMKASDNIKELIHLASDKRLLITKDVDILKQAGFAAINLAKTYSDNTSDLITIANNNLLHHSVVVEAIVAFSEIVFADEDFFKDDITIALRSISVRWLNIAYDVAHVEMSDEKKAKFQKLLDYIYTKR